MSCGFMPRWTYPWAASLIESPTRSYTGLDGIPRARGGVTALVSALARLVGHNQRCRKVIRPRSRSYGGQLNRYPVALCDADVVLAHLARDVPEQVMTVLQLHAELAVGKRLGDDSSTCSPSDSRGSMVRRFLPASLRFGPGRYGRFFCMEPPRSSWHDARRARRPNYTPRLCVATCVAARHHATLKGYSSSISPLSAQLSSLSRGSYPGPVHVPLFLAGPASSPVRYRLPACRSIPPSMKNVLPVT